MNILTGNIICSNDNTLVMLASSLIVIFPTGLQSCYNIVTILSFCVLLFA